MQKIYLLFLTLLCFINCDNDDEAPQNPADQLPETTQTGAGTFACLVDGKPFIADNPYFNCYYQYVDGGWYFGIGGDDENLRPWSVFLQTEKKEIVENQTFALNEAQEGNAYGGGGFPEELTTVWTNNQYIGELTITKLDFENYIVSGTFWFDIKHPTTGDTIKIREGRFDTLFGM